jgi:hypothetical protein
MYCVSLGSFLSYYVYYYLLFFPPLRWPLITPPTVDIVMAAHQQLYSSLVYAMATCVPSAAHFSTRVRCQLCVHSLRAVA